MTARHRSTPAFWPFWLLVAAWFCANIPSATALHACAWLDGARHFSHHAELRQSVAALLAGQAAGQPAQLAAIPPPAPSSLPPAVPAEAGVKKNDLTLLAGPVRVIATLAPVERPEFVFRAPAAPVAEVPYPPPRGNDHA